MAPTSDRYFREVGNDGECVPELHPRHEGLRPRRQTHESVVPGDDCARHEITHCDTRTATGVVSAVLSGHNHRYERRSTSGVLCLTVGTGGAPRSDGDGFTPVSDDAVRSLAVFGTLRVDVARGRVAYAFIDSAGRTRDRFAGPAR